MRGMFVTGKANTSIRALALVLSVVLPALASAQVYKWVDKDGIVTFSNIAPPTALTPL